MRYYRALGIQERVFAPSRQGCACRPLRGALDGKPLGSIYYLYQ
jgi:hypothetical protein